MKLSILVLMMYGVYHASSFFIGLLSMCEVMGIHMYIALVSLGWDYKLSSMRLHVN